MNITRYALSIALLFSVSAISAETEVTTENNQATEQAEQATVSIEDIMNQIAADFDLTEDQTAELRAVLESASQEDGQIDIAALVDGLRAEDDAVDTAVASEDTQEPAEAVDSDTQA